MLQLDSYLKLDDKIHLEADLTSRFSEVDLRRIGDFVWQGYATDLEARRGWEERNSAGMDLALQIVREKSFPWVGASNVAFPLVTIAAMQFHARAYPSLIPGKEVVKVKTSEYLTETQRRHCFRAASYMNEQLLEESTVWEEQSDRLLLHYSIIGTAFKKSFYSSIEGAVTSELVFAKDLVVDYFAPSIDKARRKSHVYPMGRNALLEGMRAAKPKFRNLEKEPWFVAGPRQVTSSQDGEPNRDGTRPPETTDPSTPFRLVEQHCWLDLDNDGYEEPYVVTIEHDTHEPVRIVARWDRKEDVERNGKDQIVRITSTEYFTKFGFIPSPDGSIYDIGFGVLLGPLNESVSTLVNQLIDAGTKASTGGGFLGKGVKIRGGTYSFSPGEWKRVDSTGDDLRKNIVPLEKSEPSPVLFQLLGLLIEYTNRIAGTVETMVGVNPGQNTPKSNMDNMLEQGMKIYAALFKRTWRAMKEEFRKIYILNAIYAPMQVAQWFKGDPRRCAPVADPNVASDTERRNRALIVAERATIVPGYDPTAVEMNLLRTLGIETPEQFYKGPPKDSPPDPKIVIEQMRLQSKQLDRELQWKMFLSELIDGQRKTEAEIIKLQADAQAALAAAEDSRDNRIIVAMQTSLALLKQRDEALRARIDQLLKIVELESEPERKTGGTDFIRKLALRAGDPGTLSPLQAQAGATEGAMGAG